MKKLVSFVLAVCLIASVSSVFAAGSEIIIDGEKATIAEGMGEVTMVKDRNFVPIRFLLEYFKYSVTWQETEQLVFGSGPNGEIFVLQVGSPYMFFSKSQESAMQKIEMDVEPFLNEDEDRTYVPLRFIAEAIGYDVSWEEATDTAVLTKK